MGVNVATAQPAKTQRVDPQRSAQNVSSHGAGLSFASPIYKLQRAVGNRAISSLLRSRIIQPKCTKCEEKSEQTEEPEEEKLLVQAKRESGNSPTASSDLQSYLTSRQGGGQPLSDSARSYFEPRFGYDFSHVRIHADSRANLAARDISARAFTAGSNIYFAQGQYQPGSSSGDRLLGHELTHVIQQSGTSPLGTHSETQQLAPRVATSDAELSIQRVADKSNVPGMICTADPAPGKPAGTEINFGQKDTSLDFLDRLEIFFEHVGWFNRGGIDTIIIEGFASTEGAAKDNWKLSCDRAEAVKAEFVSLGVPDTMITTIAHGETEEFSTTSLDPNRVAVIRMVAGVAPSVIVFPVIFGTSVNRVPPGKTVSVPILVVGVPAGRSIDLDIEGSGGANGTATVSPATITGFAFVDVTGGVQTTPGNAGNLRLRARIGGLTLDRSPGFTVAAHPTDFSVTFVSDVNTATLVGMLVNNAWTSDGTGGVAELDQVQRREQIELGHNDNPPFNMGLGTPSGLRPGNISPRIDRHRRPRAGFVTGPFLLLLGTSFTRVTKQLFTFNDARTGITNRTAVNSGFTITDTVSFNAATGRWQHQMVKTGAAVTVGGRSATAGSGTATSLVHPL